MHLETVVNFMIRWLHRHGRSHRITYEWTKLRVVFSYFSYSHPGCCFVSYIRGRQRLVAGDGSVRVFVCSLIRGRSHCDVDVTNRVRLFRGSFTMYGDMFSQQDDLRVRCCNIHPELTVAASCCPYTHKQPEKYCSQHYCTHLCNISISVLACKYIQRDKYIGE